MYIYACTHVLHRRDYHAFLPGEGYEKIVFLYQLERGQAGKSYGLNVAALAGLDSAILKVASEKSRELEDRCNRCRRVAVSHRLERGEALKTIIRLVQQQQDCFDPETVICIAKQVSS